MKPKYRGVTPALDPRPPYNESRESCQMTRVAPATDLFSKAVPPGSFCWRDLEAPCGEKYSTLWHKLPNGNVGCIPIEPVPMSAKPIWAHGDPPRCHTWNLTNGDMDKPTLSPSVHARGSWHGWFRAGRMESV